MGLESPDETLTSLEGYRRLPYVRRQVRVWEIGIIQSGNGLHSAHLGTGNASATGAIPIRRPAHIPRPGGLPRN